MERDATRSEDASASEEDERAERADETSAEDSGVSSDSKDDEEARRQEVADALGATDVNAANVNAALVDIDMRERAEANLAADAANSTAAAVGLGDVAPNAFEKGIVREKVTESEGIVIREIAEFIPTVGGLPGDGTFKNTRISEWPDGRKTVHEVRIGADGKKTITDLTTDGGVLTSSTQTTATESGWNTEVLRGGNEASDAERADYYDKIGLGDHAAAIRDELAGDRDVGGGSDGWASDGPLGEGTDIPDDTSPIDEGGSASDGPLPAPVDIPDTDPAPDEGGSASDGPMPSSDPGGPTSTGTSSSSGGSGGQWVLQGTAETGYTRVWVPSETKPESGSSGGTSAGGESGTGQAGGSSGGSNAPPGGASGSGGGGGGTSGTGTGGSGTGGTGTGTDDDDADEDEDEDDADDADDADDGDEGSERPTDEQSGGSAPDPLGLVAASGPRLTFEGGPDYDPNADPVMGSGTPQVAPQGGGVTDPPQDGGEAAPDPLGLTASASRPLVFEGGPDYDPNADPIMGSGTPQVVPGSGGGGGDPTVAMTASVSPAAESIGGDELSGKQDVNGVSVDMATGRVIGSAAPAMGGEDASLAMADASMAVAGSTALGGAEASGTPADAQADAAPMGEEGGPGLPPGPEE